MEGAFQRVIPAAHTEDRQQAAPKAAAVPAAVRDAATRAMAPAGSWEPMTPANVTRAAVRESASTAMAGECGSRDLPIFK